MAIQTIGIRMMVQGAGQFARNVSNAATSVIHFGMSVDRVQSGVIRLANAQVNNAQRAFQSSVRLTDNLTKAYERQLVVSKKLGERVDLLSGLSKGEAAARGSVTRYTNLIRGVQDEIKRLAAIARDKKITLSKEQLAQNASDMTKLITKLADYKTKLSEAKSHLKDTKNATDDLDASMKEWIESLDLADDLAGELNRAMAVESQKSKELADANDVLAKSGAKVNTVFDLIGNVLNAATGGFGKTAVSGTTLGAVIAKLGLQMNAAALILNVFKLGLDSLVFIGKLVVGSLKLVWNILTKLVSIAFQAGKAVIDWVVKGLKSLIMLPINIVVGALNGLWQSLKRIGEIAIGMNLSNLIWNLGTKIKDVGAMAVEAAGDFQLLRQRMTALLQREQLERFGTAFADSFGMASARAEELTDWISQLAVKSIFGAESIANVFTLGLAYDLTSDQAKRLTDAIVNFSTGMGLQEDQMRRIIENLGQMQAAGKLTGTEMRDLARGAFVPVNRLLEIFGESLGMDTEKIGKLRTELQSKVTEGEIGLEGFFEAFITMSNRDFPDSVNKMSKSWNVVKSNVKDFIQSVIGWRVITPTLDILSERMSNFIAGFMTPEILTFAKEFGKALGFVADGLLRLFDTMTKGLLKFDLSKFGVGFKKFADGAKAFIDRLRNGIPATQINNALYDMKVGLKEMLGPKLFEKVGTQVLNLSRRFLVAFENIGKVPVEDSVKTLMNILGDSWDLLWTEIFKPVFDEAWKKLKGWAKSIWDSIDWAGIWNKIVTDIETWWNGPFKTWWTDTGGPKLLEMINGLSDWASQSDLGTTIGGKITSKIVEWLQQNAGPGSEFVTSVGSVIKSAFQLALASGLNLITGALGGIPETGAQSGQQGFEQHFGEGEAPTGLQQAIANLSLTAQTAVDGSLKNFTDWGRNNIEPFKKFTDLIEVLSKLIGPLVAPIDSIGQSIGRLFTALGGGGNGGGNDGGINDFIASVIAFFADLAKFKLDVLASQVDTFVKAIEGLSRVVGGLFGGGDQIVNKSLNPLGNIDNWSTGPVIGMLGEVQTKSTETTGSVKTDWDKLNGDLVGNSIIPDMLALIVSVFSTKLGEVVTNMQTNFMPRVKEVFNPTVWFDIGYQSMVNLLAGFRSMESSILGWFDSFKSNFKINVVVSAPGSVNVTQTSTTSSTGTNINTVKKKDKMSKGGDFIVPPGYPNDGMTIRVESGERVIVIPKSKMLRNAGSAYMPPHIINNSSNMSRSFSNTKQVNNYLTVNTSKSSGDVVRDFRNMRFLGDD